MFRSRFGVRLVAGSLLFYPLWGACTLLDQSSQPLEPSTFPVVVSAQRDGKTPVTGVEILDASRSLGKTDDSGSVRLELSGAEGDTLSLTVRCPSEYASPEKPISVGLRSMAPGSPEPRFTVECVPLVRSIVVGLRTENGPNLPVLRLNQVVGQTSEKGVAHLLLTAAANDEVSLTLDTKDAPALQPQNPTLTFIASDRDELVLLEQKFTVKKKPVVRPPRPNIPQPL